MRVSVEGAAKSQANQDRGGNSGQALGRLYWLVPGVAVVRDLRSDLWGRTPHPTGAYVARCWSDCRREH